MSKYKLILDESGTFESNIERYIIIGGLFFCEDDEKYLEDIFMPLNEHICNTLNIDELHGSKNKEIYNYVAPLIGSIDKLYPVIFVIDKYKTFIFKNYDKKSFKYNKAIEHLIKKIMLDGMMLPTDELIIIIDNINLNKKEIENLRDHLPSNYSFVKSVTQEDSQNNIYIQFADIIVNRFSKKEVCKASSTPIKLLNPQIYCFLSETIDDYII